MRNKGIDYLIATAQRLGLHITRDVAIAPTPTSGKKRTASGSLPTPRQGSATPVMRKATLPETRETFPDTPHGRTGPAESKVSGNPDIDTITAVIRAALGPAIQQALAPLAAKINALEKATAPPLEGNNRVRQETPAANGLRESMWAPADPPQHTDTEDNGFTPVTHNERGKKAKSKRNANAPTTVQTTRPNPAPSTYAGAATAAVNTKQPPVLKQPIRTPTITEVTVLRAGGFHNPDLEESVSVKPAAGLNIQCGRGC